MLPGDALVREAEFRVAIRQAMLNAGVPPEEIGEGSSRLVSATYTFLVTDRAGLSRTIDVPIEYPTA